MESAPNSSASVLKSSWQIPTVKLRTEQSLERNGRSYSESDGRGLSNHQPGYPGHSMKPETISLQKEEHLSATLMAALHSSMKTSAAPGDKFSLCSADARHQSRQFENHSAEAENFTKLKRTLQNLERWSLCSAGTLCSRPSEGLHT